jgi:hypothetical protein
MTPYHPGTRHDVEGSSSSCEGQSASKAWRKSTLKLLLPKKSNFSRFSKYLCTEIDIAAEAMLKNTGIQRTSLE